jgi:hypothetical protein
LRPAVYPSNQYLIGFIPSRFLQNISEQRSSKTYFIQTAGTEEINAARETKGSNGVDMALPSLSKRSVASCRNAQAA